MHACFIFHIHSRLRRFKKRTFYRSRLSKVRRTTDTQTEWQTGRHTAERISTPHSQIVIDRGGRGVSQTEVISRTLPQFITFILFTISLLLCPVWGRGTPLLPVSIYVLMFSPFYFFLSFLGITYFLLLSIPSLSTRIVPLRFQAEGRRRRPNLGLVCFFV